MMPQYPTTFQICATCDYWGGQRKTDTFGRFTECDKTAKGNCYFQGHIYAKTNQDNSGRCNHWKKWCALK